MHIDGHLFVQFSPFWVFHKNVLFGFNLENRLLANLRALSFFSSPNYDILLDNVHALVFDQDETCWRDGGGEG
jgi:hypothetical protein